MGSVVFKQPNGLYGRYSYTSDSFESYNMTEEEVKISTLERDLHRLNFDMKGYHYWGDYNEVLKDANEVIECMKEGAKEMEADGESKEYIDEYLKDVKKQKKENDAYIKVMNSNENINEDENEYFRALYGMFERLYCLYDDEWKLKKYYIFNHPEDLKMITEKVKELNKTFDTCVNLSKKKK